VTPGKEGLTSLFDCTLDAEVRASQLELQPYTGPAMTACLQATVALNEATTYPLPTEDDWCVATTEDHNLALVVQALVQGTSNHLSKASFSEKAYFDELKNDRLELDQGIIYRYEIKRRASIRQLRVKLVPPKLRRDIIAACHSSPMAGHSSVDRTYHRVITRFWWPGVSRDVRNGVLGCACCRLANHTDHENQQLLYSFVCDEPFSVIFLDIWQPGEILEKDGSFAVLTMLEGMCGFAGAAFLPKRITSETMADATFSTFIPHFGLP
jgi:hypothetical protein